MARPRIVCDECFKEVAIMANGWLYPHRDSGGDVCWAGGTDPGQDGQMTGPYLPSDGVDNFTPTVTAGVYGPAPDPLTVTVAHPGGGAAGLELAEWWANTAVTEIGMVVRKAIEYGATDLRDLGEQILEMAGRRPAERDSYDDTYATEVGIAFYAMGKLARIVAAIKEGRRPSADSWLDLGVYARMAQRVHQTGGWPGKETE